VLLDFVTAFSVVSGGLRRRLCNRLTERVGVHVVDEAPPAVDLYDWDPLPESRFQLGVPVDRDLPQLEAELVPRGPDDAPSGRAEMAARGGVEDDVDYG
jgi:hypothetical protein